VHASQGGPAIGGAGEPSELAGRPLAGLIDRWDPTREVATHARSVVPAVPDEDRRLLVDAAWLHDIGYSRRCTGQDFIPWTAPGTSWQSGPQLIWWEPLRTIPAQYLRLRSVGSPVSSRPSLRRRKR